MNRPVSPTSSDILTIKCIGADREQKTNPRAETGYRLNTLPLVVGTHALEQLNKGNK